MCVNYIYINTYVNNIHFSGLFEYSLFHEEEKFLLFCHQSHWWILAKLLDTAYEVVYDSQTNCK